MRKMSELIFIMGMLSMVLSCGDDMDTSSEGDSPTGTYLDPNGGIDGSGYTALDETCEHTESPTYLDRFVTPMFRDSAAFKDLVYLVDGSLLWIVSIADPEKPTRLSLTRLPGHPLSIAIGPTGDLLVAAGDAGLLVVDAENPTAPRLLFKVEMPGLALDVAVAENNAYVALGDEGLAVMDAKHVLVGHQPAPSILGRVDLMGFANAVDVEDGKAYVAACSSISIVDISSPTAPSVIDTYWVPEGHAKELDAVGEKLFVAGGEALFAFDVSDPAHVVWAGYYSDPEARGFYVNAVAVRDNVAYIAAGDESVRAVDISSIDGDGPYLPPADGGGPPSLDGPIDLPDPSMGTLNVTNGDPINVRLAGDFLFVLGNFRWVGERLLRIMDIETPGVMIDVGAYVQPNDIVGIDMLGDALVVHGAGGNEILMSATGEILDDFAVPENVERAEQAAGRLYMLLEDGEVWGYASGKAEQLIPHSVYDMTVGNEVGYVSQVRKNAIVPFYLDWSGGTEVLSPLSMEDTFIGYSRLLNFDGRLLAYDWEMGLLHVMTLAAPETPVVEGMVDVGQCEMYDIADFYSGQKEVRVMLAPAGSSAAMLCPINERGKSKVLMLDVSDPAAPVISQKISLPGSRYVDLAVRDDTLYAVGFDNNSYRSTLTRIVDGVRTNARFDGHANGLQPVAGGVLVADGDFGLRLFQETTTGLEEVDALEF